MRNILLTEVIVYDLNDNVKLVFNISQKFLEYRKNFNLRTTKLNPSKMVKFVNKFVKLNP